MDRAAILNKVAELVAETLEVDAEDLSDETRFDELGADSFDLLELVTAFEEEFGFTMDDESLSEIQSIGDAIDAIESAQ